MQLAYLDGSCKMSADLVFSWDRGDIAEMVMSNSSGPKDFLKNRIHAMFEADPNIDRIVILRGKGVPFSLFRDRLSQCWFDATGKQVRSMDAGSDGIASATAPR